MNTNLTVDRLHELLDLKDEQLQKEQTRNDELDRQMRFGVDWMFHRHMSAKRDSLPFPRIEMHVTENSDRYQEIQITLVLPQRDSTLTRVPLSYSKCSGGSLDFESFPTTGDLSNKNIGDLPGLIHDACFFMEKTGIPAYVVLDETRKYKVASLKPLKLTAVE